MFSIKSYILFYISNKSLLIKTSLYTLSLVHILNFTKTKKLFKNIYNSFPQVSFMKILLLVYKNYYYNLRFMFDYYLVLNLTVGQLVKIGDAINFENKNLFKEILNANNSIIIFTSYTGCFYLPLFNKSFRDTLGKGKIGILIPNIKRKSRHILNIKLNSYEFTNEIELIDIELKSNIFKIIRILKTKGIIICTMDISHPYTRNLLVNIFNSSIYLPTGIPLIGKKNGSIFAPIFFYYTKNQGIIDVKNSFIPSNQLENILLQIIDSIEAHIKRVPEQWLMWETLQ